MLDNFECLFLLSPSEIKQEVCILLILISQGIDWYKVLVVGKNGKLNDTIEASALWSTYSAVWHKRRAQELRAIVTRLAEQDKLFRDALLATGDAKIRLVCLFVGLVLHMQPVQVPPYCFVMASTSGQLVSELFPDCTRSCFSQVVLRPRGGDRIYEMRCQVVAVGPNARFIVLPHWDNMS